MLTQLVQAHVIARMSCGSTVMESAKKFRKTCLDCALEAVGKKVKHAESDPLSSEGLQDRWQFSLSDPASGLEFDVSLGLTTTKDQDSERFSHYLSLAITANSEAVVTRQLCHFYGDLSLEGQKKAITSSVEAVDVAGLVSHLLDYATP